MKSKWYHLKHKAVSLRKQGNSIREIELKLGIPRSTLSGWFKDIALSKKHQNILKRRWEHGLVKARKKASNWHREQKKLRHKKAEVAAQDVLDSINLEDPNLLEVAVALLYLGEGYKNDTVTGLGSSDPMILNFFVSYLKKVHSVTADDIHCDLNLRADQNEKEMYNYWSKELNLPARCFKRAYKDPRTKGKKTYDTYKGVCQIRCRDINIQRKLIYLSKKYCDSIIEQNKALSLI